MRLQSLSAVVLTAALSGGTMVGQSPQPAPKTATIAAFKNGLGFFVKQGRVAVADGWAMTTPLPNATLGTLWVSTTEPGTSIEELIATEQTRPKPQPVSSVAGLLAANTGQTITVQVGDKEYTGELFAFPAEKPKPEPVAEDTGDSTGYYNPYIRANMVNPAPPAAPTWPDMLTLKIGGRLHAFRMGDVRAFSFPENPRMSFESFETTKHLKFKVKGAKDSVPIVAAYLQKGFGWTPSYLISLKDEKNATVSMQAVLINDVEDISDGEVSFVVGFPNFAFSNVPSPMSGRQSLAQFLQLLQQGGSRDVNALSNAVITQQAMSYRNTGEVTDGSGFSTTTSDMSGTSEEDLFLYKREHVTLKRGERGTYSVFSGSVGYEHVYTWDIPDTSRVDIHGQNRNSYDRTGLDSLGDKVWHSVRLKNTTDVPWTTAPALVLSGEKPLAQDTLGYTPRGANTDVRLTVATDVRVDKNELESERMPNAKKWGSNTYDGVTVEGTLKLKNYKSRPLTLCIQKLLIGEVGVMSDAGTAERIAVAIQSVNPTSRIKWEVPLKPGEEKTVTYKYRVYVYSH